MTQTPLRSRSSFFLAGFLILASVVTTGCDTRASLQPLDDGQRGLTAIAWGSHPDTAKARMLEMEGLTLVWDSVHIFAEPMYRTPDTIEVSPTPVRWRRLQRFEGGTFLGLPVEEWQLQFDRPSRLCDITVIVTTEENPVSVFREMRMTMRKLFGDPIVTDERSSGYVAYGWKKVEKDAATTNVRIWHWQGGSKGARNRFVTVFSDKMRDDSLQAQFANRPRVAMHVDEWERLKKKLLDEIEKGD